MNVHNVYSARIILPKIFSTVDSSTTGLHWSLVHILIAVCNRTQQLTFNYTGYFIFQSSWIDFTVLVLPELFDTLVHGLEGVVDTVDWDVCIDVDERLVHPCLIPLLPVCSSDLQVLEGFKLLSQPTHLVILQKDGLGIEKSY